MVGERANGLSRWTARARRWWPFVLLLLAAVVPYLPTLGAGFIWDDDFLIRDNPAIKKLEKAPHLFSLSYWTVESPGTPGQYRPMRALVFAVSYSLWGLDPLGYRLTNLALYILIVWFVYVLGRRLLKDGLAALLAGLLFALHPAHSEVVAWVKNITELMGCLFVLGGVWAFWKGEAGSRWAYAASVLALPLARGAQFHPVLLASGALIAAGVVGLAAPRIVGRMIRAAMQRLPFPRWLRDRVVRLADALTDSLALWREGRNLWPLLALSVLAALCEGGRLAAVFAATGPQLGLPGAMLTFSVANLVAILVFIPGGIGVAELSMAGVAGAVLGVPATLPSVTAAVLLDRVLSYYLIVGIGALVLVAAGRPAGIHRRLA